MQLDRDRTLPRERLGPLEGILPGALRTGRAIQAQFQQRGLEVRLTHVAKAPDHLGGTTSPRVGEQPGYEAFRHHEQV